MSEAETKERRRNRQNGEGSIHQRKDGTWAGYVTVSSPGEKQRRRWVYGKKRADVARKVTDLLKRQDQGLPIQTTERLTVAKLLDRWLEATKPAVRHSTYSVYEVQVRRHLSPGLGRLQLAKLSPADVSGFLQDRLDAGLSPRSVQLMHRVLHMALGLAVRWELVARNVAALVDPPRVPRPELHTFSVEQATRFLESVRHDRLYGLYVLTLSCGLRRGEVLALRWDDLDLDRGTLAVRHTLAKAPGGWQLAEPKTAGSRRVVKLARVAVEALRDHRIIQLREQHVAGSRWVEHRLVFPTTIGTPMDGDNLLKQFQSHLRRAELPVMPFHALRHSAATLLLALGVQPKVVAEMLGHSRIGVTMDIYSHVLPHLQDEAASKMDRLLATR